MSTIVLITKERGSDATRLQHGVWVFAYQDIARRVPFNSPASLSNMFLIDFPDIVCIWL